MHTTSRLILAQVDGTDEVSVFPASFNADMATLDNAAIYSSGTLVARPAATAVVAGTLYLATDTALLYESNGTVWQTVMLAGAWVSLTLETGIIAATGFRVPSARLEGDVVRLKGVMENNSGGTLTNAGFAIVPTGLRPSASVYDETPNIDTGATCQITVSTGGVTGVVDSVANGNRISLEGRTFPLT